MSRRPVDVFAVLNAHARRNNRRSDLGDVIAAIHGDDDNEGALQRIAFVRRQLRSVRRRTDLGVAYWKLHEAAALLSSVLDVMDEDERKRFGGGPF